MNVDQIKKKVICLTKIWDNHWDSDSDHDYQFSILDLDSKEI